MCNPIKATPNGYIQGVDDLGYFQRA